MKIKIRAALIILTLITIGVVNSLLINYASETMPQVIKDHPYYVWLGIGISIFLIFIFTLLQTNETNFSSPKKTDKAKDKNVVTLNGGKFDVFISYSSKDRDWVLNVLKKRLLKHGFSVITDTDFQAGSLSISEMAKAVENSKHTIAVLTPEFIGSKWTKLETAMAQTLDPDANLRKLIPVLRQDCDIPLHIQVLHYRDMRNDNGWDELIEDLL